jgi:hypothetical protein
MPLLILSRRRASLLRDVIDIHVEGVLESKNLTVDDPTITDVDQLLSLMAGYDDDLLDLKRIRRRLNRAATGT